MMIAAVTVLLCSLVAVCAAAPEPFQPAEIQWHRRLTAPSLGCVEIRYTRNRVTYRSYMCDGSNGACVLSFNPVCPRSALFHRANLDQTVTVRGRQHSFRYYNQIGRVCYHTLVPTCCRSVRGLRPLVVEEEEDCKCVDLPNGVRLCDPVGCESEVRQVSNQQFLEDQLFNQQFLEDQLLNQQLPEDQLLNQQLPEDQLQNLQERA